MIHPVYDGIVATAGGGQANGVLLQEGINRVSTVATAGDSVKLPDSDGIVGMEIVVINATANSMNLFPATGEAVNALAANAAYAIASNRQVIMYCVGTNRWHATLSA